MTRAALALLALAWLGLQAAAAIGEARPLANCDAACVEIRSEPRP